MKKIIYIIFLILLNIINTNSFHLFKDFINASLNGTFIINSIYNKEQYFGIDNETFIPSNYKREFDIIKISDFGYILKSRYLNKLLGVDKNNSNNIIFYNNKNFEKENKTNDLIIWNLYHHKDNEFLMENQYNKKYIKINASSFELESLNNENISLKNIDDKYIFRFLKLYEEYDDNNLEIIDKEPIDVFIKYIDLTDKSLNREGIKQIYKDYDNKELKYSLRGILEYIPWVRKIFILLPNQKVSFLKPYSEINEKIIYVNDKEFLGFDSANIFAFSFNLYKMEKFGISKNFIYMEDDYFIGQPLKKSDFFYYDQKLNKVLPYIINTDFWEMNQTERLVSYKTLYKKKDNIQPHTGEGWDFSITSTDKYFIERYNMTSVINPHFTHSAIAENIDDLKEIYLEIQYYKYIKETLYSKTRHVLTLNQPHFHNLYLLNIKQRKVHKVPNRYINMEELQENLTYIKLFVINTCGNDIPTQRDYINAKKVMEQRFPNKTKYELNEDINLSQSEFQSSIINKFFPKQIYNIKIIYVLLLLLLFSIYLKIIYKLKYFH